MEKDTTIPQIPQIHWWRKLARPLVIFIGPSIILLCYLKGDSINARYLNETDIIFRFMFAILMLWLAQVLIAPPLYLAQ
ncbi:MAG: hypothetical protein LIP09_08715 [Bacteroidales bacterium]|nr:hypothetical protein [Bacteroidales bacterium]